MYYVAVLANLKKNAPQTERHAPDEWGELDAESTIEAIQKALRSAGHRTIFVEANIDFPDLLRCEKPDICFNIAEGCYGDSRESQVPAVLEMLNIPYTGSKVLTNAISLDKPLTKRVWSSYGLRTAPFQVFDRSDEKLGDNLKFPAFVKPSREGTGIGIFTQSVVKGSSALRERVAYILDHYDQPALVEPFLPGREFTIGVLGNRPHQYVFPPIEINTQHAIPEERGIYTHRVKADIDDISSYMSIPTLEPAFLSEIQALALDAHNAINTLDVSRVDIRCDEEGVPYLLEINTLPGMNPTISDLIFATKTIGMNYEWLINSILNLACHRYNIPAPEIEWPK